MTNTDLFIRSAALGPNHHSEMQMRSISGLLRVPLQLRQFELKSFMDMSDYPFLDRPAGASSVQSQE